MSSGKRRTLSRATQPKRPPPEESSSAAEGGSLQQVLPPPDTLARYNNALPSAAARIMSLAERDTAHRAGIERTIVEAGIKDQRLRMYLMFAIVTLAVGGGVILIAIGKDAYGIAAIITSLVALVGLFLKK